MTTSCYEQQNQTLKCSKKIHILKINAMRYRVCIQFLIDVIHWIFELSGQGFTRDIIRNAIYLLEKLKSNMESLMKDKVIILMIDELDALITHDRKNFDVIIDL